MVAVRLHSAQVVDLSTVLVPHVAQPDSLGTVPDGCVQHDSVTAGILALWPGDVVYVRSQGDDPLLAGVEKIWTDASSQVWLSGTVFGLN